MSRHRAGKSIHRRTILAVLLLVSFIFSIHFGLEGGLVRPGGASPAHKSAHQDKQDQDDVVRVSTDLVVVNATVLDKDGKVVREFDGPGAAGVNRTTWDLRQNPAAEPTPEQEQAIAAGYGFGPRGPLVELGEYTIKIKAGDKEATQKVTVEDDNRITLSAADRRARHDAIEKLYAMEKTTGKDRTTIQGIQTALTNARDQWKKDAGKPNAPKIPDDIVKAADELQKRVDAVAEKFARPRQALGNAGPPLEWKPEPLPNQVQDLLNDLDGFAAAPGGQQQEKLAELTALVSQASTEVQGISETDLPALNKKMNDAGIPHIVAAPPQPRRGPGGAAQSDR